MAAVVGLEEGDVGVGDDLCAALGGDADEGVVERVEDEGGDGDAVEDAGGGGAVVVVVGAGEAGVEGGDAVVEVAQGADAGGAVGVVGAGEEAGLAAEAAQERAEELELVEAIDAGDEARRRRGQGRRAGETPMTEWSSGGALCAEVAGELEDEVAAHGVADEGDGLEVVAR